MKDQPVAANCWRRSPMSLHHPEGVAVAQDEQLYVGRAGRILRHRGRRQHQRSGFDGRVHLVAADGAGRLYVCDNVVRTVWWVDPKTAARGGFTWASRNAR